MFQGGLRKNGFFKAVLFNVDTLEEICRDYLEISPAPNVAGLCAELGCTPLQLQKLFTEYESIPTEERTKLGTPQSPNRAIPSESAVTLLANAIMHIEAMIVEGGLLGSFNAHMGKFVLSAFHNRHEKQLHESKTDNTLNVTIQSHQPVSLEELREYDRLEQAIEEEQRLELIAMGKLSDEGQVEILTGRSIMDDIKSEKETTQEELLI